MYMYISLFATKVDQELAYYITYRQTDIILEMPNNTLIDGWDTDIKHTNIANIRPLDPYRVLFFTPRA